MRCWPLGHSAPHSGLRPSTGADLTPADLTPADLTPAERTEAETVAAELAASGRLGQFVICLTGRRNEIADRDLLAAVWCWELNVVSSGVAVAA